MPLLNNDILRVTCQIHHPTSGTRTQNIYHWQCSDVVSQVFADIKADFAARLAALYDNMKAYMLDTTVSDGFKLVDLTTKETYGQGTWTFAGLIAGQQETSPQVAAEVIAYTFEAGRFGRKYLGPFTEVDITNGMLGVALKGACETFGGIYNQTFVGAATGNTYLSGVARKVGGVWTFKQFATALGVLVAAGTRTQRSRTAGRGLT